LGGDGLLPAPTAGDEPRSSARTVSAGLCGVDGSDERGRPNEQGRRTSREVGAVAEIELDVRRPGAGPRREKANGARADAVEGERHNAPPSAACFFMSAAICGSELKSRIPPAFGIAMLGFPSAGFGAR